MIDYRVKQLGAEGGKVLAVCLSSRRNMCIHERVMEEVRKRGGMEYAQTRIPSCCPLSCALMPSSFHPSSFFSHSMHTHDRATARRWTRPAAV